MSISATDLVFYGAASMPENNTSNVGGAIDTTCKVVFTDISATDTVEVLSSSASDTMTCTVTGRTAAGAIVSEPLTLNGTSQVSGATSFERILKIILSSTSIGTITVRKASDNVTIATLEPGISKVRRLFYDSSSDASGGSTRNFYEKIFVKNNHATLTLTNAYLQENADPTTKLTFDVSTTYNDTGVLGGRLNISPSGLAGSFTSSDKFLPNSGLPAGSGVGIWLNLTLAAGDAATKSTYTLRLVGTTT